MDEVFLILGMSPLGPLFGFAVLFLISFVPVSILYLARSKKRFGQPDWFFIKKSEFWRFYLSGVLMLLLAGYILGIVDEIVSMF